MPEIKRPNYFTSQFLVEKDFNDEQAYHLNARRRHNRQLHTAGVATGLDVTRVGPTQVQIGVGTAIDGSGREIVLNDARTYSLVTAGSDLDVFLTVAYQEIFDPADHDTQAGLDKFTRTTERVQVQDGTAVPPTDGSVVVLAKIRLSTNSQIGSIDTTVRALSSAAVAPKAITTVQLADGAVTLAKLATEAQPLAVLGANAITVNTNNTLKQITVGENHSARIDNPHATTATQIDTQGGANQLVARINAGTGVIVRSRLESTVVSGVMTFQNVAVGMEMFSNDIDPGFGVGALCVQLALDDLPTANITLSGDTNYARTVQFRSEINRNTGKFRIFILRPSGPPTTPISVAVRWYAFKPQAGVSDSTAIAVNVTPNPANMIGNTTQVFTATVANTTNGGVTWSIDPIAGGAPVGSLSLTTPTSTTYTPPINSGDYVVRATSVIDPNKSGTATVHLNAAVTVIMSTPPSTVFRGASLAISATVINTPTTSVTWKIVEANGGTLSNIAANSVTYTAPLTTGPSTFTVRATSTIDNTKTADCVITVPAVSLTVNPPSATVFVKTPKTLTATVLNATDTSVTWNVTGGAANGTVVSTGPTTATYTAPGKEGPYTVNAVSVSDPTKSASCAITVPAVGVTINPPSATVIRGTTQAFTATVVNATDTSVTWSATGGTITPTGPTTATYTAPAGQGNFTVNAASVADPTKSASCAITVPAVTISVAADSSVVTAGSSTTVRATITGTTDLVANWQSMSLAASVSPATGTTTTWFAPGVGGDFDVKGISRADPNKFQVITIHVPNVKDPQGEGPPGKFLPVEEKVPIVPIDTAALSTAAPPPADAHTDTSPKAKSFVRPKKRQDPKLPPKPSDG